VIKGAGVEVVDVARFRAAVDDALAVRLFLPDEVAYCRGRARPWECYAARAAAKRATLSALVAAGALDQAAGDDDALWRDIEVVRSDAGDVDMRFGGRVAEAAEACGALRRWVSLAHTKHTALAVVVLESMGRRGARE
jgi:holo-[acyl-carrier protein] synthase